MRDINMTGGSGLAPSEIDKAFSTPRALLAFTGHVLSRTDAGDGPHAYFVSRWGMVHEFGTMDDVQRFADQIGSRHA